MILIYIYCVIDVKQIFDIISRKRDLYTVLQFGVSGKFERLSECMLTNFKGRIESKKDSFLDFHISSGIKQGDSFQEITFQQNGVEDIFKLR